MVSMVVGAGVAVVLTYLDVSTAQSLGFALLQARRPHTCMHAKFRIKSSSCSRGCLTGRVWVVPCCRASSS